jgi:hypothetical protein
MFRTPIPLRTAMVYLQSAGAWRAVSDEELERLVEWLGRVWETNQDN